MNDRHEHKPVPAGEDDAQGELFDQYYYRVWYDSGTAPFREVLVSSADRIDVKTRASYSDLSDVLRRDGVPNLSVVVIIETAAAHAYFTLSRSPREDSSDKTWSVVDRPFQPFLE